MIHTYLSSSFTRLHCVLVTLCCSLIGVDGHAQTLLSDWWQPSGGQVNDVVAGPGGDVFYLAGSFNKFGPCLPYAAVLDGGTGQPILGRPTPDNTVHCAIADGAGGWYIGGYFDTVGVELRPHVARINADGTLHAFQVDLEGVDVSALVLDGSTLYIGGSFTAIGGQVRGNLAAVDANSGAPLPFAPMLAGGAPTMVLSMVLRGGELIFGGSFATVSGSPRNNLASVDKLSGAITTWNPNASATVHAMTVAEDGGTLYVGGGFTSMGGNERIRTAAFNLINMGLLPWTVAADDEVHCMDIAGDVLVLGGEFDMLGGLPHAYLGAVNASTAAVLPWIADAGSDVSTLVIHDNVVYVGGLFDELAGQQRYYAGAVDLSTGALTPWHPIANTYIYTLAQSGGQWLAGGWFNSIGCKVRRKFVALDAASGMPTDWDPQGRKDYGTQVFDLELSADGQVLYGAGAFNDTLGGQPRRHLIALSTNTAQALPWAPQPDGLVNRIRTSPDGTVMYAGGQFNTIAGSPRSKLAALGTDPQQTQLLPWDPACTNGYVQCMDLTSDGSTLFVSGTFTAANGTIGGQPRDRLAALSTTSNNATGWTAPITTSSTSAANVVDDVLLDPTDEVLYLGGTFNAANGHLVSGAARDRLAAVSTSTGAALPWNPGANDQVLGLNWGMQGDLIVSGKFDGPGAIGGVDRIGFAYLDPVTADVRDWSVLLNYGGYGIKVWEFPDLQMLSGYFAEVNDQPRLAFGVFSDPPGVGVREPAHVPYVRMYPNPTASTLHLPADVRAGHVELYDGSGRKVIRHLYAGTLALDDLSDGLYTLIVFDRSGAELGRGRVMVQH